MKIAFPVIHPLFLPFLLQDSRSFDPIGQIGRIERIKVFAGI